MRRANWTKPLSCNNLVAFLFYIRSTIQDFFVALLKSLEAIKKCGAIIFTAKYFSVFFPPRLDRKRRFCVCLWTIFSLLFGSFSYLMFAFTFRFDMERFVLYCFHFIYIIAFSSLANLSMISNHFFATNIWSFQWKWSKASKNCIIQENVTCMKVDQNWKMEKCIISNVTANCGFWWVRKTNALNGTQFVIFPLLSKPFSQNEHNNKIKYEQLIWRRKIII